ncbi:SDH family Clp fold serine proteinase [uncultured Gordonia sp.]|uniref:SDH family Clp fold serine proteinase n=1 Tax=uncultured Gordonia sp. TaxID=198437 RepID=UPI00258610FA|nr:S49 family peptidase [uncultured Gordonia sp.]
MENKEVPGQAVSVNLGDVQGFMEACYGVKSRDLDLIITSPGGSPDAAESIMDYLRTQFDHIRAIIPVAAMSAATMMSLAADEIIMGNHSQLGPIDPQLTVMTPEGPRSAPGQAILDQFEQAKRECQDPANIGAWLPMLRALLPGLLAQCQHSRDRAEQFARTALEAHMFAGQPDAADKADIAAAWFADFSYFKSHGRRVSRDEARTLDLTVTDLESDPTLQDLVLSVHHAVRHTFNQTPAVKIIENDDGVAYIEAIQSQQVVINGPHPVVAAPPAPDGTGPATAPGGNRAARRQAARKKN